jgi:anti-sigma B factor antagonist
MTTHADEVAPRDFALTIESADVGVVVAPTGDLDVFTSPRLRQALDRLHASSRVVVDMDGVTFIDSSALGVLLGAARRLASEGGELIVRRPRPSAYRVFEMTCTVDALRVER